MEGKKEKIKLTAKETLALTVAMYRILLPKLAIAVLSLVFLGVLLNLYL